MGKLGVTAAAGQGALFSSVRWPKAAHPRRVDVLQALLDKIDWGSLVDLCRPYYFADLGRRGRKGHPLLMMVRAEVLRRLWSLSDEAVEAQMLDSHSMAAFVGLDPWAPRPPSASALRNFRQALTYAGVGEKFEAVMLTQFRAEGVSVKVGKIRDPVIRQTRAKKI